MNNKPQPCQIRPTVGPFQSHHDICTVCFEKIKPDEKTFSHVDACNQSWHRDPCFENFWLQATSHSTPPYYCPNCSGVIPPAYPCRVEVEIIANEKDLSLLEKAVGVEALQAKPLADRKLSTITTEEFISRIMQPETKERAEQLFDLCFGVLTWSLYNFSEQSPKILIWAIPEVTTGDYQNRLQELAHYKVVASSRQDFDEQHGRNRAGVQRGKYRIRRLFGNIRSSYRIVRSMKELGQDLVNCDQIITGKTVPSR